MLNILATPALLTDAVWIRRILRRSDDVSMDAGKVPWERY